MAFQGGLEEAPLPDVIQLLSLGRKTGCLSLTEGEMQGEICLEDGRVCHAAVFGRRDRLGDMLVRTGRITRQQLDSAIAEQQAGGKRVSETLLDSGTVQRPELEQYVRRQVEEAVYFMFTWRTGSFAFTSSVRPKHQDIPVSIDPEGLLLEGARRVDEWSLIEKKIPSLDLVFRLDRTRLDATQPSLTPEQEQLLPLIDGSRDVHGLIEVAGLAEFTVGKALFGLISAGFVSRVERRAALRHLDYREMLAYVVREAEFADPDRRRAAARHIADCGTCTQRLKTIHVRRTGAIPSFRTTEEADAALETEPVEPDLPTATATLPPDGIDRRSGERRSGEERRHVERRHGERRVARSPEWERPGRDRRSGADRRVESRRIAERRIGAAGDWQSAVPAASGRARAAPQRSRGFDRRTTGPRRIRPQGSRPDERRRNTGDGIRLRPVDEVPAPTPEQERRDRRDARPAEGSAPEPAAEAKPAQRPEPPSTSAAEPTVEVTPKRPPVHPSTEATVEVTPRKAPKAPAQPAAEATVEVTPRKPAAPKRPDPELPEPAVDAGLGVMPNAPPEPEAKATPAPVPASVAPPPRPEPPRKPARTTDIEWLVTPSEADHLLRTSRAGLAGGEPGKPPEPAPVRSPEAGAPDTARKPAAAKRAEKGGDHKPVAKPAKPAPAKPVAREAPAPVAPPPAQELGPAAPAAAARPIRAPRPEPDPSAAPAAPAPGTRSPRFGRWIGVAAALVAVGGVGLLARPFLGLGGADPLSSAVPAASPPTVAEAPVEPPTQTVTPGGQTAEPVTQAATPPASPTVQPAPAARPAEPPVTPPAQETRVADPPTREAAPPPAQPAPTPTVGMVRGVVRDAESGGALAGVRVTIPGTTLSAVTDAAGAYTLAEVPAGRIAVSAARDGRITERQELLLERGGTARVDFALTAPTPAPPPPAEPAPAEPAPAVETPPARPAVAPTPREADEELTSGGWTRSEAAAAAAQLRTGLATIPGLWIESIAVSEGGSRPRVRVALLTSDGERIVLTETRSGAPELGTPRVTALRIIPASDAYPITTGTASFGSLLVTAKSPLPGDTLRALLAKLELLE